MFKSVRIKCSQPLAEIIMAEMALSGYNSFVLHEDGFETSISSQQFDSSSLRKILRQFHAIEKADCAIIDIEEKNWNEEWEKNYDPVIINNRCLVRASFHKSEKEYPLEIVIDPKMSFGTGHHDTTFLMIENQFSIDHKGLCVLDAGCGTGILSIVAEKRGASKIIGFDIDPRTVNNAKENIKVNNCDRIEIREGTISIIEDAMKFHLILANINRNTFLEDLPEYAGHLFNKGLIICSGFLAEDINLITEKAKHYQIFLLKRKIRNKWASLVFTKKTN